MSQSWTAAGGRLAAMHARMAAFLAAAVLSWGWGFVPFVADFDTGDVNSQS